MLRMELVSRRDPHLREVVWFAACCRALTLLLQASLPFLNQRRCDICCLLLQGFSLRYCLAHRELAGSA